MSEFHDMLARAVAARKLRGQSIRAVAQEVGGHFSTLANAMSGKIRPPEELLEGWGQLFDDEEERRRFVRLGYLQHATPQILAIVKEMADEIADLRAKTAPKAATTSTNYEGVPENARFKLPKRTPK